MSLLGVLKRKKEFHKLIAPGTYSPYLIECYCHLQYYTAIGLLRQGTNGDYKKKRNDAIVNDYSY